jgi:hypothetical protein
MLLESPGSLIESLLLARDFATRYPIRLRERYEGRDPERERERFVVGGCLQH